jgi:hypothetical protein
MDNDRCPGVEQPRGLIMSKNITRLAELHGRTIDEVMIDYDRGTSFYRLIFSDGYAITVSRDSIFDVDGNRLSEETESTE